MWVGGREGVSIRTHSFTKSAGSMFNYEFVNGNGLEENYVEKFEFS